MTVPGLVPLVVAEPAAAGVRDQQIRAVLEAVEPPVGQVAAWSSGQGSTACFPEVMVEWVELREVEAPQFGRRRRSSHRSSAIEGRGERCEATVSDHWGYVKQGRLDRQPGQPSMPQMIRTGGDL